MEKTTKNKALEKLELMNIKIGYPNKWREYKSELKSHYSYFKNNILCNMDDNMYMFKKLYQKVDKDEWFMNPQDVNAYYSPQFNEIVFPAGILQPPFFSMSYDNPTNFGGIGCIIGHELTHGFDDMGCKYDGYGKLHNWWTKTDLEKYIQRIDILKQQFSEYSIMGEKINTELTLGENIADLGGTTIALNGLKKYLTDNNMMDMDNSIKQFFSNYAVIWRSLNREEQIKQMVKIDPHSPPCFRVNGIVKNIDDFYRVFNIQSNDTMYLKPSERAKIW